MLERRRAKPRFDPACLEHVKTVLAQDHCSIDDLSEQLAWVQEDTVPTSECKFCSGAVADLRFALASLWQVELSCPRNRRFLSCSPVEDLVPLFAGVSQAGAWT